MKAYEQTIFTVLREIATQRKPDLPPLDRSQSLTYDLGLQSLDLAQLVATLELELQADPFARLVPITSVSTVGDVCDAYQLYFEGQPLEALAASRGLDTGRVSARPHAVSAAELRRQARGQRSL